MTCSGRPVDVCWGPRGRPGTMHDVLSRSEMDVNFSPIWMDELYRASLKIIFQDILCGDKGALSSFEKCLFKAKQKETKTLKILSMN